MLTAWQKRNIAPDDITTYVFGYSQYQLDQ